MSNDIVEARILNDPGEGFQSRDMIYSIAQRLISHTKGKIIGGYTRADNGQMVPSKNAYSSGDLVLKDALYAVEYALTRGLNPYGHLHLWYQRSSNSPHPQLIIDIDYKILKGWAEMQCPFRTESFPMGADERETYGLSPGDLGAIAYNILDSEAHYLHQYKLQFLKDGMPFSEAQSLAAQAVAKSKGVGVVRASEMTSNQGKKIPPPKGRTWQWRAETRAMRDAIRRSHGDPPPAKIRQYAEAGRLAISANHLPLLADPQFPADLPADDQERYLQLAAGAEEKPHHDMELANRIMRNNGDDDPLDLSPEPEESEEGTEAPPELVELRQALIDEAEANPRKGPATETQCLLVAEKMAEALIDIDEGDGTPKAIVTWLFGDNELKFHHAQALLKHLLLSQDKETGDYPLNSKFIPLAQAIYAQAQKEKGQLELF